MNINDFKCTMDKYGGPAISSLFHVELYSPDGSSSEVERDFRFLCHIASLPGFNLVTQPYRPDNIGIQQAMPIGIEGERLDVMVYLDDQHHVLNYFHSWIQRVYNYSAYAGKQTPRRGDNTHLPYEINYKSDYEKTMIIRHFSQDGQYYEYAFTGVYPVDLGAVRMSWADNGGTMDLPVNFGYSSFMTTGTRFGSAADVPYTKTSYSNGIISNTYLDSDYLQKYYALEGTKPPGRI